MLGRINMVVKKSGKWIGKFIYGLLAVGVGYIGFKKLFPLDNSGGQKKCTFIIPEPIRRVQSIGRGIDFIRTHWRKFAAAVIIGWGFGVTSYVKLNGVVNNVR